MDLAHTRLSIDDNSPAVGKGLWYDSADMPSFIEISPSRLLRTDCLLAPPSMFMRMLAYSPGML